MGITGKWGSLRSSYHNGYEIYFGCKTNGTLLVNLMQHIRKREKIGMASRLWVQAAYYNENCWKRNIGAGEESST